MKRILSLVAGAFLVAGSAWALPSAPNGYSWTGADYFSLTDMTTADATFTLYFEDASYESAFGLYTLDEQMKIDDEFEVFAKGEEPDYSDPNEKSVYFQMSSGEWEVSLDNANWWSFGSTFGFYFDVYADGVNDTEIDYRWFTDTQFNQYATGELVNNDIEHILVAVDNVKGTRLRIWLDDQLVGVGGSGSDRDFNDMRLSATDVSPVPEPTTMLLLGSGLVGLAGVGRRRQSKER